MLVRLRTLGSHRHAGRRYELGVAVQYADGGDPIRPYLATWFSGDVSGASAGYCGVSIARDEAQRPCDEVISRWGGGI